jgi:hypothetical protein
MIDVIKQVSKLLKIKGLVVTLYLVKAILSLLLIIPIFLSDNAALSSSSLSRQLLKDWDISILLELFSGRTEVLLIYILYIIIGGIIYLILMQFLNGGIYHIAVSGQIPIRERNEFFAECGTNFGNNLKITGIMLMAYLVLFPAGMFLVNILGAVMGNGIGSWAILVMFFKLGILATIFLLSSIFSDLARAAAIAYPEKPIGDIVRTAAMFYRPNLLRLFGAYFVTYIPFLIIWGGVEILALQTTRIPTGIAGVFFEFALFQISSLARTAQKLWYLIYLGREFKAHSPGRFLPKQVELKLE